MDKWIAGVTPNFNSLNEFLKAFGTCGILIFFGGGNGAGGYFGRNLCRLRCRRGQAQSFAILRNSIVPTRRDGFCAGFVNDLALPSFILGNIFFWLSIRKRITELESRSGENHIVPSRA
ncbi:MAG TPA: hypothetical protein VKC60_16190 [Opitutaceae bacterium]|nr:hypothetical protein [Opitutaceae bacterium]